MADFDSPSITTREQPSSAVAIPSGSTSIPFFIGTAGQGPINRSQLVLGPDDFLAIYGPDDGGDLYQSVSGFFQNGGEAAYIVRIAHYTDITDPTTLTAVSASAVLANEGDTPVITVRATSEGAAGNLLAVSTTRRDKAVTVVLSDLPAGPATEAEIASASQIRPGVQLLIEDPENDNAIRVVVLEILAHAGANGGDVIRFASATVPADGILSANVPVVTKETLDITFAVRGRGLKPYVDLSMSPLDTKRYFGNVIGTNPRVLDPKQRIYVEDALVAASAAVDPRPVNANMRPLSGGLDGGAVTDNDYAGAQASHVGLWALEENELFSLGSIPGVETVTVQRALVDYASYRQDFLAILDAPEGLTPSGVVEYKNVTANLAGTWGAMYAPRLRILRQRTGAIEDFPSAGYVLGAFARTDARRNVAEAAAGVSKGQILGVVGVARNNEYVLKGNRDIVYSEGINPIYSKPGRGVVIWGQNTLDPTSEYGTIGIRRAFIALRKDLNSLSQFVLFEVNDDVLRGEFRKRARSYLRNKRIEGVLKGSSDNEAFYVQCDKDNNPDSVVNAKQFYARVGVNIKPGIEQGFIDLELDARGLEAELAAAA